MDGWIVTNSRHVLLFFFPSPGLSVHRLCWPAGKASWLGVGVFTYAANRVPSISMRARSDWICSVSHSLSHSLTPSVPPSVRP